MSVYGLAPSTSDIPFILAVLLLAFTVGWHLMQAQRALGWVTTKLLARFVLPVDVIFSIRSIQLMLLSGRILFGGVRYFDSNSSFTLIDGYICIEWWRKGAKLKVHLNGAQLTLYNNDAKYRDIAQQFEKRQLNPEDGTVGNEFLMEDEASRDAAAEEAKPLGCHASLGPDGSLSKNPNRDSLQRMMSFLVHLDLDVREGTIAMGTPSPKYPFFFHIAYKRMQGKYCIDEKYCRPEDLYRHVLDSTFTDISVRLVKVSSGRDQKERRSSSSKPDVSHHRDSVDRSSIPEATPSPSSMPPTTPDGGDRRGSMSSLGGGMNRLAGVPGLKRLAQGAKELAAGMRFAFYGDLEEEAMEEEAAKQMVAEAAKMRSFLNLSESEQVAQGYGTVIDKSQNASIRIFYFQDTPGVELKAHEKRTVEDLPQIGLHIDILAETIRYSSLVNLMRQRITQLFFPWDYRTYGVYRPKNGEWRAIGSFQQVITFSRDTSIVTPWRQKRAGFDPPKGVAYSGVNRDMNLFCAAGSKCVIKVPYTQFHANQGVMTEIYFQFLKCRMTTSMNKAELFSAAEFSVNIDCLSPPGYIFNEHQTWDYIIQLKQAEVYYLADHMTYFFDFIADWSYPGVMYLGESFKEAWSGSREFFMKEYAPNIQRFEVFFSGMDLKLNANDSNVICSHASDLVNTILNIRMGEGMIEFVSPGDVFTIAQENEFCQRYNIRAHPCSLSLSLPPLHEVTTSLKGSFIPEVFATMHDISIRGEVNSSWPNTHEAQGNMDWVPRRDPPAEWAENFHRKPCVDHKHAISDLLTTDIRVDRVTAALQGWHLRYLGNIASNYGGADYSFVSPESFSRFADAAHPDGRNVRAAFGEYLISKVVHSIWKAKEYQVSLNVTSCQVYLPLLPGEQLFHADAFCDCDRGAQFCMQPNAPPTAIIPKGDTLQVHGTKDSWARCRWNCQVGWVRLSQICPGGARTSSDGLTYRPKPAGFWSDNPDCGDFIDVCFHELNAEVSMTPTNSDMAISLSPITARCPVNASIDKRSHSPEFFLGVQGASFNTSSLYGPLPDAQCFVTRQEATVGRVTGNLLISQIVLIEEIATMMGKHMGMKDTSLQAQVEFAKKIPPVEDPGVLRHKSRGLFGEAVKWYAEHELNDFRRWLEKRENAAKEAQQKASVTRKLHTEPISVFVRLDLGYVTAQLSHGLSAADTTLCDAFTSHRGSVTVPHFSFRLLHFKGGHLLREMEGDHLEVGKVAGAVRVRYTEASRSYGTGDMGGQEAQAKFLQRFNLSKYGMKAVLDLDTHHWDGDAHGLGVRGGRRPASQAKALRREASRKSSMKPRRVSLESEVSAVPLRQQVSAGDEVRRRRKAGPAQSRKGGAPAPPTHPQAVHNGQPRASLSLCESALLEASSTFDISPPSSFGKHPGTLSSQPSPVQLHLGGQGTSPVSSLKSILSEQERTLGSKRLHDTKGGTMRSFSEGDLHSFISPEATTPTLGEDSLALLPRANSMRSTGSSASVVLHSDLNNSLGNLEHLLRGANGQSPTKGQKGARLSGTVSEANSPRSPDTCVSDPPAYQTRKGGRGKGQSGDNTEPEPLETPSPAPGKGCKVRRLPLGLQPLVSAAVVDDADSLEEPGTPDDDDEQDADPLRMDDIETATSFVYSNAEAPPRGAARGVNPLNRFDTTDFANMGTCMSDVSDTDEFGDVGSCASIRSLDRIPSISINEPEDIAKRKSLSEPYPALRNGSWSALGDLSGKHSAAAALRSLESLHKPDMRRSSYAPGGAAPFEGNLRERRNTKSYGVVRPPELAGFRRDRWGSRSSIEDPLRDTTDKTSSRRGALEGYARCLRSAKLHIFRGAPDTALVYGRAHLHGSSAYSYAPHPNVHFEDRGRATSENTLFTPFGPAGSDPASAKRLLTPSQTIDTTENQRDSTTTQHTHVAFLQPLHALVTQRAACLVIHGMALHRLWKSDLQDRNGYTPDPEVKEKEKEAAKPHPVSPTFSGDRAETVLSGSSGPGWSPGSPRLGRERKGLSFKRNPSTERLIVRRAEKIVSMHLHQAVLVCAIGLTSDSNTTGCPDLSDGRTEMMHTVRCVVQNIRATQSVRSAAIVTNTGRQPATTQFISVGEMGVSLNRSLDLGPPSRGIELPAGVSPELSAALTLPDHSVLAVACVLSAGSQPAVSFRSRGEEVPGAAGLSQQKASVRISNIHIEFGKDVLLVSSALGQLLWVNMLWKESKVESPALDEEIAAETLSDTNTPRQPDITSPDCMSFVLVDHDSMTPGGSDIRTPSLKPATKLKRVRTQVRRVLFGATESVAAALKRRGDSIRKQQFGSSLSPGGQGDGAFPRQNSQLSNFSGIEHNQSVELPDHQNPHPHPLRRDVPQHMDSVTTDAYNGNLLDPVDSEAGTESYAHVDDPEQIEMYMRRDSSTGFAKTLQETQPVEHAVKSSFGIKNSSQVTHSTPEMLANGSGGVTASEHELKASTDREAERRPDVAVDLDEDSGETAVPPCPPNALLEWLHKTMGVHLVLQVDTIQVGVCPPTSRLAAPDDLTGTLRDLHHQHHSGFTIADLEVRAVGNDKRSQLPQDVNVPGLGSNPPAHAYTASHDAQSWAQSATCNSPASGGNAVSVPLTLLMSVGSASGEVDPSMLSILAPPPPPLPPRPATPPDGITSATRTMPLGAPVFAAKDPDEGTSDRHEAGDPCDAASAGGAPARHREAPIQYLPWLFASLVLDKVDLRLAHSKDNFLGLAFRNTKFSVTNRAKMPPAGNAPHHAPRPAAAQPVPHDTAAPRQPPGHRHTHSDAQSEVSRFGSTTRSLCRDEHMSANVLHPPKDDDHPRHPGHRVRVSDEQLSAHATPSGGPTAQGDARESPRGRGGEPRKRTAAGTGDTPFQPEWVVSMSITKKSRVSQQDCACLSYHCLPLTDAGDLYDTPQEIFSVSLRSLTFVGVLPKAMGPCGVISTHLALDRASFKLTSYEWLHTEHCLREWQKLVLRWRSALTRPAAPPPDAVGSPFTISTPPQAEHLNPQKDQHTCPAVSVTVDITRIEVHVPLTEDAAFTYAVRRAVLSYTDIDRSPVFKLHVYPSVVRAGGKKEAALPSARFIYTAGPPSSARCYIDKVDVVLTKDIVNAWIQVYTVITPQLVRWAEGKTVKDVKVAFEKQQEERPSASTGVDRGILMWAGFHVSLLGSDTEAVASSGLGVAAFVTEEERAPTPSGSFKKSATEILHDSLADTASQEFPHSLSAPMPRIVMSSSGSPSAASNLHAPAVAVETRCRWYARLPKIGLSLTDAWEHRQRLASALPDEVRRPSVVSGHSVHTKKEVPEPDVRPAEQPLPAYRWAGVTLALYAGNHDVERLASADDGASQYTPQTSKRLVAAASTAGQVAMLNKRMMSLSRSNLDHRKYASGNPQNSPSYNALGGALLGSGNLSASAGEVRDSECNTDKLHVLVVNIIAMARAGVVEQASELMKGFTESFTEFQVHIEKDRQRLLQGETIRRIRKEGRKWIRRTAETVERARDPDTYITSRVGSFVVRNISLTIPFGDRAYRTCRLIGVHGADALHLESGDDDTLNGKGGVAPSCLKDVWRTPSGRFLPSQALQLHLGEASLATMVGQDEEVRREGRAADAVPPQQQQQPQQGSGGAKRVVVVCRARDAYAYFSDGTPLPPWSRDSEARIDPRGRWHREFGPNFSNVVGGKGVFLPPCRELAGQGISKIRTRCCIKEITVKSRARVWQESVSPLAVTCDFTGPEVRIAPNILTCLSDLSGDFEALPKDVQMPEANTTMRSSDPTPVSPAPSLGGSTLSDTTKIKAGRLAVDLDLTLRIEAGTISVNSDECVPEMFQEHSNHSHHGDPAGKANADDGTAILKLPTPIISLRGTLHVPHEPDYETGVDHTLTASATATFPSDTIEVHPTAVYFTHEVGLWERSWQAKKAQRRDNIDQNIEGLKSGLREGFTAAQLEACKVSGMPYKAQALPVILGEAKIETLEIFINDLELMDVLVPVPRALIDNLGCSQDCMASHDGVNCLRCGEPFEAHTAHMCPFYEERGLWIGASMQSTVGRDGTLSKQGTFRSLPVGSPLVRTSSESNNTAGRRFRSSSDLRHIKTVTLRTAFDPPRMCTVRVEGSPMAPSLSEMEKMARKQLNITSCWDIIVRDAAKRRVRLTFDDVLDGEVYLVELVGLRAFLSLRLRPVVVAATTVPLSDCQAVMETGTIDLTLMRTPAGDGSSCAIMVSTTPLLTSGCCFRVAVKDRLHECMSASVASFTAAISPGNPSRTYVYFSGTTRGPSESIRCTVRVGHLRSFFVVYKLWKKRSDEAKTELMKIERAKMALADTDRENRPSNSSVCSQLRDDCTSHRTGMAKAVAPSRLFIARADSVFIDVDNFRLTHTDSNNDKFQLASEDVTLIFADRKPSPARDNPYVKATHTTSPVMSCSEAVGSVTPPGSSIPGSHRDKAQFPMHVYQTRVQKQSKSPAEIRSLILGVKLMSFESQGRISSPSTTRTSDYLLVRAKQLMNAHKLKCNDESSSTPLQIISVDIPPLEVDLREMYKPLLKLRLSHKKKHGKPAGTIRIRDVYRPLCRPSGQSPLQGYQVDVSLVVETLDVDLRPTIFPKIGQVTAEVRRTRMLQELEADKTLNVSTKKKWSLTSKLLDANTGTSGRAVREGLIHFKSGRARNHSVHSSQTPTSPKLASPRFGPDQPEPEGDPASCEVLPRGIVAIEMGTFTLNLGQSTTGQHGSSMQLRTKQFKCEMAQNLQRVDQRSLWDLLDTMEGKRLASPPLFTRALASGTLPQGGTVGRSDRIIKDLVITSWRVSRIIGDVESPLLQGDRDSMFSMHTNQYVGSNVVEYNFWSKFQQAWCVGKTQEFIALREWLEGFAKEAHSGSPDASNTKVAAADVLSKRTSPYGQAGGGNFGESSMHRESQRHYVGVRERLNSMDDEGRASSLGGLSSSVRRRSPQAPAAKGSDERVFVATGGGFEFSPVLQVVGESTLPVSAIFTPLGLDEAVVPTSFHCYLGDSLGAIMAAAYTAFAPLHVVKTNQALLAEFDNAHTTVVNAYQEAIQEEAKNVAGTL